MQKPKTILICVEWFYPAFKAGGPIASILNLINQYNNNINYKVYCSNYDLGFTPLTNVPTDTWVFFNEYTSIFYASEKSRGLFNLKKIMNEINPDIVFVIGIFSIYFNLFPMLLSKKGSIIISVRGMLHPQALFQKKMKKKLYLNLISLLNKFKYFKFHATNQQEKNYIEKLFSKNEIKIAENFPNILKFQTPTEKKRGSVTLITIALISPMKNHLNVLKALRNCIGDIIYIIYGPIKDENYWNECQLVIKSLPENISVNYAGEVSPLEVERALKESHLYIQPSESENYGHSIVEALMAGKPVITSHNTPWINLESCHSGANVDPNDLFGLREKIELFCNMDKGEYYVWCQRSKTYIQNKIDINRLINSYNELFINK